jgi:glycosyltransferase involved in cell wall biosynthesis
VASFTFWAAGSDGSTQYRCDFPKTALGPGWRGHQVYASQQLGPQHLDVDVLVGSRVALPAAVETWRQVKKTGHTKLVLDLDDDYFHIDPSNEAAAEFWTPALLEGLKDAIWEADIVTVASEGLKDAIAKECAGIVGRIEVIENGLPAQYLGYQRNYNPDKLTIGWAGSANTAAWLPLIVPAVNKAAAGYWGKECAVRFIGAPPDYIAKLGFKGPDLAAKEWIPDFSRYQQAVSSFDIWLAPYRSTPFTEAKFPTKAMEAGFHGIPIIASPIRGYRDWIDDGESGFLARYEHNWTGVLGALIREAGMREHVGMASTARASSNILQALGKRWEEVCLG